MLCSLQDNGHKLSYWVPETTAKTIFCDCLTECSLPRQYLCLTEGHDILPRQSLMDCLTEEKQRSARQCKLSYRLLGVAARQCQVDAFRQLNCLTE